MPMKAPPTGRGDDFRKAVEGTSGKRLAFEVFDHIHEVISLCSFKAIIDSLADARARLRPDTERAAAGVGSKVAADVATAD